MALARNDQGFAEAGSGSNQKSAAAGAEALGPGNAIYDACCSSTRRKPSRRSVSLCSAVAKG